MRKLWAVLAMLAALACLFVVVGKFTWGSELGDVDSFWVSTDTAFWAGLGVMGFSGLAFRMWQPPRDEEPLWSKWLDVAFWSYFAVGMVAMVIWHASRDGSDDGVGWPIVFLVGFFAILTIWRGRELGQGLAGVTHPCRTRRNRALTVGAINLPRGERGKREARHWRGLCESQPEKTGGTSGMRIPRPLSTTLHSFRRVGHKVCHKLGSVLTGSSSATILEVPIGAV